MASVAGGAAGARGLRANVDVQDVGEQMREAAGVRGMELCSVCVCGGGGSAAARRHMEHSL